MLFRSTGIVGRTVGKIDVKGVYSFFEVANADKDTVMNAFKAIQYKGREVRIEISGDDRPEGGSRGGSGGGGYQRREGGGGGGFRGNRREGGNGGGGYQRREGGAGGSERSSGGGFRDFSGKRREDRSERRNRS